MVLRYFAQGYTSSQIVIIIIIIIIIIINIKLQLPSQFVFLEIKLFVVVCFLLGNSPASEFYIPTFQNTLSVPS